MEEPSQPPQPPRTPLPASALFTRDAPLSPTGTAGDRTLYSLETVPNSPDPKEANFKYEPQQESLSSEDSSTTELPYHVFGRHTKLALVLIVSATASLSGLSSNIYFPAMTEISDGLDIPYSTVSLTITTYLLAQGIAPSFWGPLADLFGRRTILIATLTLYLGANLALALVQNAAMLLIFRALQAAGSSSTISLGAGVIADIACPAERGGYLGMFSGVRQFSIAIGPVLGGVLAGTLGFRSIFWFLFIFSSSILGLVILAVPETLRRIAGSGCDPSRSLRYAPLFGSILPYCNKEKLLSPYQQKEKDLIENASHAELRGRKPFKWTIFTEPLKMLGEKDVACALTFGACTYTAWSMMTAQTTSYLKDIYGFSTIQVGLAFLANGLGCVSGSILAGRNLNSTFQREASLWRHFKGLPDGTPMPRPLPVTFPVERARLSDAPMYSVIQIVGLLIFGWSLTPVSSHAPISATSHWITPLFAQFAIGYSNTAVLNSNNTLIVDLYPGRSASASAVINLTRNLTAAVGVAVADYITAAMSPGWYGTLLAGIVVVGLGPYYLHSVWGPQWRERRQSSSTGSVN